MANDQLVLQINKVNTTVDNKRLKYNQAERGKQVDVTVIDNDGVSAYDLTGKTIIFNEDKIGNKIIIDGGGGAHSGKFITNPDDLKQGKFTYQFTDYAMEQSGEAQFEFETDSKHIDVSSTFFIDITATGELKPANTSYVSDMEAFVATYNQLTSNFKTQADAQLKSITDQVTQAISNAQGSVKTQLQTLSQSVSDEQTKIDNSIKSITDKANQDTQTAIAGINSQYTTDFGKLKDQFTTWESGVETNVNKILAQVKQNNIDATKLEQEISTLKSQLGNIDFTKFVKPSDLDNYYTKTQVDGMVKNAGSVKTATINGGAKVSPDASGNLALTTPNPDLSGYETKADATQALSGKADKSSIAGIIKTVTVNGGSKISADASGNLALTTPNPDLSGLVKTSDLNSDLNNYTKTSNLLTWFESNCIHHASSEADADNFRKSNPNFPIIVW